MQALLSLGISCAAAILFFVLAGLAFSKRGATAGIVVVKVRQNLNLYCFRLLKSLD
jgi:hypothetical protein